MKKLIAILLALLLVSSFTFLTGCGQDGETDEAATSAEKTATENEDTDTEEDEGNIANTGKYADLPEVYIAEYGNVALDAPAGLNATTYGVHCAYAPLEEDGITVLFDYSPFSNVSETSEDVFSCNTYNIQAEAVLGNPTDGYFTEVDPEISAQETVSVNGFDMIVTEGSFVESIAKSSVVSASGNKYRFIAYSFIAQEEEDEHGDYWFYVMDSTEAQSADYAKMKELAQHIAETARLINE